MKTPASRLENQAGKIIKYSRWSLFRMKFWPVWFWKLRKKRSKKMELPDGDGQSIRFYPWRKIKSQ